MRRWALLLVRSCLAMKDFPVLSVVDVGSPRNAYDESTLAIYYRGSVCRYVSQVSQMWFSPKVSSVIVLVSSKTSEKA